MLCMLIQITIQIIIDESMFRAQVLSSQYTTYDRYTVLTLTGIDLDACWPCSTPGSWDVVPIANRLVSNPTWWKAFHQPRLLASRRPLVVGTDLLCDLKVATQSYSAVRFRHGNNRSCALSTIPSLNNPANSQWHYGERMALCVPWKTSASLQDQHSILHKRTLLYLTPSLKISMYLSRRYSRLPSSNLLTGIR